MNKFRLSYLFVVSICGLPAGHSWAQTAANAEISGSVQAQSGGPLLGATVAVMHLPTGIRRVATTNAQGHFDLSTLPAGGPYLLRVSESGFLPQTVNNLFFSSGTPSSFTFELEAGVVVVAASRVEERIGQVPVTVEKISQRQIEQLATPDLTAGLARFKGIDVSSSSLLTASFSTRGFNSSRSERVIQLSDYMDTQVPSLSSYFGNLQNTPVLDVASVEIVHGPASALYGANAFNGVLLTNSKDPFLYEGLTVRVRGGSQSLFDAQLRYATKIGERVAFKISAGATVADEFFANNQDATSSLIEPSNNAAGSNLGYDAVSRHGDLGYTYTTGALAGKTVFLPGYTEEELITRADKTHSYKIMPSLAVKLGNGVRATVDYKYTEANTTYQNASRYRFMSSGLQQGRVQLQGANWFVRSFATQDFSGGRNPGTDGGYSIGFLGAFLQTQLAPNFAVPVAGGGSRPGTYAERYFGTYNAVYNQNFAVSHNADAAALAARTYANANAPQLQPGSPEFAAARDQIVHDPTPGKGARVVLRSVLSETSGQYTFRNSFADVTVGGAYRQFMLGSDGSLFEDTKDGSRLRNYEYGTYAQASKTLLNDHLKLSAAGRVDQFKNFGTAFSPRASAVYSLGPDKQQNFRASFSRAFRAPTQTDQYIRLDVGRAILLGNVGGGFQGFRPSLGARLATDPGILAPNRAADLAAYEYIAPALKLEQVNTFEVGYRAQLLEKLYVDLDYYFNTYNNFITTQSFIGNVSGSRPSSAELIAAASGRFQSSALDTRVVQISANVDQRVQSHGAGLTLAYAFAPFLTLNGNYSYNELLTTNFQEGTQSFFNTPRHKFNLGFDGQALNRTLSYNLNYRWADAFLYESAFATGTVPTAQTVDAQVGYTLKSLHTTVQAGGTNLFNTANLQVYGAPSYGRIGYLGLLFDIK